MATSSLRQGDIVRVPAVKVLDGSAKLLPDTESETDTEAMEISAHEDEFMKARARDLQSSILQEFGHEFQDYSDSGGIGLTQAMSNARNGVTAASIPTSPNSTESSAQDERKKKLKNKKNEKHVSSAVEKLAGTSLRPASPKTTNGTTQASSSKEKVEKQPIPIPTQDLSPQDEIIAKNIARGFEWFKQQDGTILPGSQAMRSDVKTWLDYEEDARKTELLADSTEQDNLLEPTPARQPTTWLENVLADYPGGLSYDLRALLLCIVAIVILPIASIFLLLTLGLTFRPLHSSCNIRPLGFVPDLGPTASQFRPMTFVSALGPSIGLPDFCLPSINSTKPSTTLIVLDPLGLDRVLNWHITLPHLQNLNTTVHTSTSSFSILDATLKRSSAVTAHQFHATILSHSATARAEALSEVQKSIAHLAVRYQIFLSALLHWSQWTCQDLSSLTDSSHGLQQSLLLLWGPWLNYTTPVDRLKEHMQLPVNNLIKDLGKLTNSAILLETALLTSSIRAKEFKTQLIASEDFFQKHCLVRSPLSLGRRVRSALSLERRVRKEVIACQGWDPRAVVEFLKGMEREEEVVLTTVGEVVERMIGGIWPLWRYYAEDVLKEVGARKGRGFGGVQFHTLGEIRNFMEEFARRSERDAESLRDRMGI